MEKVKVVSVWNKKPTKWEAEETNKNKKEWRRVNVSVPYGQKMAMCIVDYNGRKVTRHMFIDR